MITYDILILIIKPIPNFSKGGVVMLTAIQKQFIKDA